MNQTPLNGDAMPSPKSNRLPKTVTLKKPVKKQAPSSLFPKTKTVGRWVLVYSDEGEIVRRISRPVGKTSVPLSVLRKAARKVRLARLQREADGK